MLFVVAEPGSAMTPEDLWEYADKQLPAFAVPRYLRLVDEIPKTPSAKVRKVELREIGVDDRTFDRRTRSKAEARHLSESNRC